MFVKAYCGYFASGHLRLQNRRAADKFDVILSIAFPEVSIDTWEQRYFQWATIYACVCLFLFVNVRQTASAANVRFPKHAEPTRALLRPF